MAERERFLPMEESEMWKAMVKRPLAIAEQFAEAQKQIKQLQDLLRHEKERATMFRNQRDDLQARLDEIGDIAGR